MACRAAGRHSRPHPSSAWKLETAGLTMPPCALHFFSSMISHFLPPQVLSESLNRHERFLSCARRYTRVHARAQSPPRHRRPPACTCRHTQTRRVRICIERAALSLCLSAADPAKRTTGNLKKKRRRDRLFDLYLNPTERDKAEFSIGPLPFSPGGKEEKKNKRYLYDSSC